MTNITTMEAIEGELSGLERVAKKDMIKGELWKNIEIDSKVLIKNSIVDEWVSAHYAGLTYEGKPTVWDLGGTSWTTDVVCTPRYIRLPGSVSFGKHVDHMTNLLARC